VIGTLRGSPRLVDVPRLDVSDPLANDDLQLALWCCYELHYLSFADVDDGWEWHPGLLAVRAELEAAFVRALVDEIGPVRATPRSAVGLGLRRLADGDGPSLSRFLCERGTREQVREFLVHRSAYQRKEADPHTWAIPRVRGRAKAAMVQIQSDEYGAGDAAAMHAELFATTMSALALDPTYGAYLELLPGTTLATDNLISFFGLHRRWRAAAVGHLALFEMTSTGPMQRYSHALARLGVGAAGRRFYDVHVIADAVHERLAQDEMVAGLLEQEPNQGGTLLFGARALAAIEARFARQLLDSWAAETTSLRAPILDARAAS
jgi:hypothetical protein